MPISQQEKARRIRAAQQLELGSNHAAAIEMYRALLREEPRDAFLHYLLAVAHLAKSEPGPCLRAIGESIRLRPDAPEAHAVRAMALRAAQRLDEAMEAIGRALALDPANLIALETKGDLLYVRGQLAEGIELMLPASRGGRTNPQYLASLARLLTSAGRSDEAMEVLERAVADPGADGRLLSRPHMQLGQLLEKRGDYEGAWGHYEAANQHRGVVFNPELHEATVETLISTWTAERMAALPRARNRKAGQLVFILGMPRSGTSLVEQILASHPEVYGGGELNFVSNAAKELLPPTLEHPTPAARLESFRQSLLDRESQKIQKAMTAPAPRAGRFTDKLPQNFMHLGLVELLFPEARVIHCRRDPRDVCLSCYTRLFGGGNNQPYAGDLWDPLESTCRHASLSIL